jgi:hypothetical protein
MAMRLDQGADELAEVHDKPIYLSLKSDLSLAIGDNPVARERLADVLDAATKDDKEERIFIPTDRSISPTGWRTVSVNTRSGLLKTTSVFQFCPISRINTLKRSVSR